MIYTGVDEVGYGAFAGPIVAVAVTLSIPKTLKQMRTERFWPIAGVRDSKKMTALQRTKMRKEILSFLIDQEGELGMAEFNAHHINENGYSSSVGTARDLAVIDATTNAGITPDMIIVDGNVGLHEPTGPQICIPKADDIYWIVAAASVIAKTYRDNLMVRLAREHPEYGWERNKGYGTAEHIAALKKHGMTPYHREQPCKTARAR